MTANSQDEYFSPAETGAAASAVPDFSPDDRYLLDLVRDLLKQDGFYAYLMIDEQQRWIVAADDEAGRVDVRLDIASYQVQVCGSSPGLYMEEDSEWRRQALERLARRVVPNISRGLLDEHESAYWNEADHGVEVCRTLAVDLQDVHRIPVFVRQSLDQLDDLLTRVESELRT